MAWIESHTNLDRHHKLIRFQTALRWSRNEAVGFLHRFWWSVLEVSPSGDVTALTSPEVMSETLNMKLDVVQDVVLKLVECGFLDRVGEKVIVHDWLEYSGRYLSESLYKRHPEKMSEVRLMHGKVLSEDCPRTVQGLSLIPDRTKPTKPDRTKPKTKDMVGKFVPPSVDEVKAYANSQGFEGFDAETFVNFYESKGWMVGKNKMQRWHAAVSGWHNRNKQRGYSIGNGYKKEPVVVGSAKPVQGKYSSLGYHFGGDAPKHPGRTLNGDGDQQKGFESW